MITFLKYLKQNKDIFLLHNRLEEIFRQDNVFNFNKLKNEIYEEKDTLEFLAKYIYIRRRSTMGRCYLNLNTKSYVTLFRKDHGDIRFSTPSVIIHATSKIQSLVNSRPVVSRSIHTIGCSILVLVVVICLVVICLVRNVVATYLYLFVKEII
jgi:hypothetical protein